LELRSSGALSSGFWVLGSVFRVWGLGFGVEGLEASLGRICLGVQGVKRFALKFRG